LTIDPVHVLSASLGVASTLAVGDDLQHLMNTADKALYRAKALGRNQVVVAS
jgi:diguanylate cyclase (GGDEF)-like protein